MESEEKLSGQAKEIAGEEIIRKKEREKKRS